MADNNFTGYEYVDVAVDREMKSVYVDGYQNFGWSLEDASAATHEIGRINMKFKRDRKIVNKMEITRLQRQFEACVAEISALEKSKTKAASMAAYLIGILGTIFMGGATFAYLGGHLPLCIILAIPGFIGWIIPHFCKKAIYAKRTATVNPLMEKKYDEIYDVCERAHILMG